MSLSESFASGEERFRPPDGSGVYRIRLAWRIGAVLVAATLAALAGYTAFERILRRPGADGWGWVAALLVFTLLMGGFAADLWLERLRVSDGEIERRTLSGTRVVPTAIVAGFRRTVDNTGEGLALYGPSGRKVLQLNGLWARPDRLRAWTADRFPDLDRADAEREEADVHRAELAGGIGDLGFADRLRNGTRVLAWIGFSLAFVALALPVRRFRYVELALFWFSALAIPAALWLKLRWPGIVALTAKRGSRRPSIDFALAALVVPAWCALASYPLLHPAQALRAAVLPAALAAAGYAAAARSEPRPWGHALLYLPFCFGWGWGMAVFANGVWDRGRPEVVLTHVRDKRISSGRHTTYELFVDPFGDLKDRKEIDVGRGLYRSIAVGDPLLVAVGHGALGWRWVDAVADPRALRERRPGA